ncbi:beta-lactamase/transpeptidase-like protein [Atractiella rhizophila]|nr:beta-lactamase/transpeptidase-like protein [Atractiella rhizophila]
MSYGRNALRNMIQLFLPVLCFTSLAHGVQLPLQAASEPTLISPQLRSFIEALQNLTGVPGIGLGIVKFVNGSWVEESIGFGKASDAEGHVVDGDTLFNIGSNSKAFTALAYSFLQHENGTEFSYREKVKDLLPDWGLLDPVAERQASVLDILSHRHGVPRHALAYGHEDDFVSNQRKLGALYPSSEFREHWQYNNMMYITAGRIIALHAGQANGATPYESFLQKHIFTLLQMEYTTFSPDTHAARMAKGYYLVDGKSYEIPYVPETESGRRYIGPAGGVISSAKELNFWVKFLIDSVRKAEGLSFGSNQDLLRPEAVKEMVSGHMISSSKAADPLSSSEIYGMGFSRFRYRGKDLVWHGGAIDGFGSQIAWSPMEGIGIVVLVNTMGIGNIVANAITLRVFEELTSLAPRPESVVNLMSVENITSIYPSNPWAGPLTTIPSVLLPSFHRPSFEPRWSGLSLPIDAFEGTYRSEGYGTVHVCRPSTSPLPACTALYALNSNSTIIMDPPSQIHPADLLITKDSISITSASFVQITPESFQILHASKIVDYKGVKRNFLTDVTVLGWKLMFDVEGKQVKGMALTGGFWGAGEDVDVTTDTVEDYLVKID